ncbi:MAG: glycosyltransferase family 4 protein [Gammaproteobacteria bacterium]
MKALFIHQNFPGQFKHLACHMATDPANQIVAVMREYAPGLKDAAYDRFARQAYRPARAPTPNIHHYVYNIEASVLNGQAVARLLHGLKRKGFTPDVTFAHVGWGEALYFKDVFPDRPLIGYCEFYYRARSVDADFDPEFPITEDDHLRIRTRNAVTLLSLDACDKGVSPTNWQKGLFPREYQNKIALIHDGIDVDTAVPNPRATFTLRNGLVLQKDMEIVTFTARNLEPYRGFHVFMRAVEQICRRRPNCHVVISGGDDVSYSARLPEQQTYREKMLGEVSIDPNRVHFIGFLPYADHLNLLQVSTAHVYLTVPFVLSWSLMEAMATECVVIGSDTPPVREVLHHGKNGLLVDFFSPEAIADAVDAAFSHPRRMAHLGAAARRSVAKKYHVNDALVEYRELIEAWIDTGVPTQMPKRRASKSS